mmetsp:Transcript_78747/g.177908  ORF Transcript_78747/g.177908 Transcript_78747/m.177908 type:complete len:237 (-) Transcript_78747:152-862(-)
MPGESSERERQRTRRSEMDAGAGALTSTAKETRFGAMPVGLFSPDLRIDLVREPAELGRPELDCAGKGNAVSLGEGLGDAEEADLAVEARALPALGAVMPAPASPDAAVLARVGSSGGRRGPLLLLPPPLAAVAEAAGGLSRVLKFIAALMLAAVPRTGELLAPREEPCESCAASIVLVCTVKRLNVRRAMSECGPTRGLSGPLLLATPAPELPLLEPLDTTLLLLLLADVEGVEG